jgi:hypothetical protein
LLGKTGQLSDFNRRESVTLKVFLTNKLSSGKGNVVTFCASGHVYFKPEFGAGGGGGGHKHKDLKNELPQKRVVLGFFFV